MTRAPTERPRSSATSTMSGWSSSATRRAGARAPRSAPRSVRRPVTSWCRWTRTWNTSRKRSPGCSNRGFGSHAAYSFWYVMGNKGVTTFANVLFNAYIADLETCFKLMPLDLLRSLHITSEGFGMEAEITGKLLARGIRPFEVPITYRARSREAGKKITWQDGVEAVWILARTRLSSWRQV